MPTFTLANARAQLQTLRGTPDRQASVYNAFMPVATEARQQQSLSPAMLAKLAGQALNDLADITAEVNHAEEVINAASAAAPTPSDPQAMMVREMQKQTALRRIRDAFEAGRATLTSVCQTLLSSGDRLGFESLRDEVPWLVSSGRIAGELPQGGTAAQENSETLRIIATFESQLFSPDEKALALIQREMKAGIGWVRQNGQLLEGFMTLMQKPSSMAGMFQRPRQLYTWPYLPETRPAGTPTVIALTDDFGGKYSAGRFTIDGPQFSIKPYRA